MEWHCNQVVAIQRQPRNGQDLVARSIDPQVNIEIGLPPMSLPSLDQFSFHHALAATQGPVLVLFSAPRCGACLHWKALLAEFGPREGVPVFEVDVQRDPGLAQEFSLFHLPALYLYHDGEFHAELQAEASPEALRRAITAGLAAPAQEAP